MEFLLLLTPLRVGPIRPLEECARVYRLGSILHNKREPLPWNGRVAVVTHTLARRRAADRARFLGIVGAGAWRVRDADGLRTLIFIE